MVVHAPYLITWPLATMPCGRARSFAALASSSSGHGPGRGGGGGALRAAGARGSWPGAWSGWPMGARRALEAAGPGAALWLENTAGGGGHLGGKLGELAQLFGAHWRARPAGR